MITLVNGEFSREGSRKVEHADFLNIFHKILENIKINHDLKNFQRRKSHIILLYKFIQI